MRRDLWGDDDDDDGVIGVKGGGPREYTLHTSHIFGTMTGCGCIMCQYTPSSGGGGGGGGGC
jgi:hypothetical protein